MRRVRRHIIIFGALFCSAVGAEPLSNLVPLPPQRPAEVDAAEIVPSPCRLALETIAQIVPLPARKGPGACGGSDMVSLAAVRLPDGGAVAVSPPAELRCEMATQIANWVRNEAAPAFAPARLTGIVNYDSYDCRGRNRVAGAKVSEHGKGNAIDVRGFILADRRKIVLTDVTESKDLREGLRDSACRRFTTVLGPGSDAYHEQHIHLDVLERRAGYRICQWAVREPTPPAMVASGEAVPLPPPRPPVPETRKL
jgi:hypothetical protein